jgi:hypothetical protein
MIENTKKKIVAPSSKKDHIEKEIQEIIIVIIPTHKMMIYAISI